MSDSDLVQLLRSVDVPHLPASSRCLRARLHRAHHALRLEQRVRRGTRLIVLFLLVITAVTAPLIPILTHHASRITSYSSPVTRPVVSAVEPHSSLRVDWRDILRQQRILQRALKGEFPGDGRA